MPPATTSTLVLTLLVLNLLQIIFSRLWLQRETLLQYQSVPLAKAVNINTLLDVIDEAGNIKTLAATFNGAQLTSNNLERAMLEAGENI